VTPRAVIDTNVMVGALLRRPGSNRSILRACFEGRLFPIMGQRLFLEYEDVLSRDRLFKDSPLSARERRQLLEAFFSVCEWIEVYYLWRPNLRDEGDNHVVEVAVAGGAAMIVTNNVRDFQASELRFPGIQIVTPKEALQELS
jgi:putative PIN family toxin of toxin-antitoxin system